MSWGSCPNDGTQSEKIGRKCTYLANITDWETQEGTSRQILPRREKYYNIVSLTNTSNFASIGDWDWETYEWTKRANIAAICQKPPSSAKLLFFQQSKQKKLQISIRIGGLCIHSRCKHHMTLFFYKKKSNWCFETLYLWHSHVQGREIRRGKVFSFFLCRQENL